MTRRWRAPRSGGYSATDDGQPKPPPPPGPGAGTPCPPGMEPPPTDNSWLRSEEIHPTGPRWWHAARDVWTEIRERDVEGHRLHLERCLADPATSLTGHRVFSLLMFAAGIVVGLGAGIAW